VAASSQVSERRRVALGVAALVKDIAIPLQAEGLECAQNPIRTPRHDARRVQVFHAQQPLPAMMAGIEVAAESGDQRSEMQGSGG
jgi:hypothetical protein